MVTIKKLIKLDFYAMKSLFKIMLAFLIIPAILGIVVNKATSIMIILTFLVFMLNSLFAITEKSNFNKLYGTLPIKKNAGIISRYIFSILIIMGGAMVACLLFIALSLFAGEPINWLTAIESLTVSMVLALFFISIQYPFYYHFEYTKATVMSILPYIVCFAIGAPLIQFMMKDITFYTILTDIITYAHNHTAILVLSGLAVSVLLITSSCILSIKIQKKEF